jgi:hypothetical protein
MQTVDDNAWLGKAEAAALLGVSVRQLELKTAQGLVRKETLPKKPNERAARVVYSREDLDAIRAGRPNRYGDTSDISPSNAVAKQEVVAARDPFAGLARQLAALARAFPPPAPKKQWLGLKEASEYSGLPARWLRDRARAGGLRAQNVGEKRERWMFPREGLR